MGVSESSHQADVKTVIGFQIWLRLYIEKGQNRCCNVKAAGGALYSSIQNCLDRILIFYRLSYNLFFLKKGHSHILMGDQDKIQNTALKHNGLKITIYIYIDNIYSWKSVDVHTVFHFSTDWSKTNAEHLISIHCLHLQIKILYFIQCRLFFFLNYIFGGCKKTFGSKKMARVFWVPISHWGGIKGWPPWKVFKIPNFNVVMSLF